MIETLSHVISQEVSEIFDLYTELHGARVSLFGPGRKLIYPEVAGRPDCAYCQMLRKTLGLDSKCRALDQMMMDAALKRRKMISYTCHAGMREAVFPLFSDGQLAGYVMIGQFRCVQVDPVSPYAEQWAMEQGDDALQRAFVDSLVFPEEKIETILAMLSRLVELIIRSQLIQHKDYDLIAPVIEQIQQSPEAVLTLEEAALMSRRSPSTVTRLFKKITGQSFKQYQVGFRLQKAAGLLAGSPNRPVAEVAAAVGFDDPFYFSRLFHRHVGLSPSDYRNQKCK